MTSDNAARLNRRVGELEAEIKLLSSVIAEQKNFKNTAQPAAIPAIDETIRVVNQRIETVKQQHLSIDREVNSYLTSVHPADRALYLTARKSSEIYPKIPYYIPGTPEKGEFWVEPTVTDKGLLSFQFKFIDLDSAIDKIRSRVEMDLAEIEETQRAILKLHEWSDIAHKQKLRRNYQKRAACFPVSECPPDGEVADGKSSTEIRFNVYEDGSTSGRIQRNKGRFIEGYNISIDSAMLLQAYLSHVISEAKLEYRSGTQNKADIDKLFQ